METALTSTLGAAALVLVGGVSAGTQAKQAAFKAAWIYVGPHNDGGWSQAHDDGRPAVQKALGSKVKTTYKELKEHEHAPRVARDVESAELSGVSGTPTFFINGQRHHGAYDIGTLTKAVKAARARQVVAA